MGWRAMAAILRVPGVLWGVVWVVCGGEGGVSGTVWWGWGGAWVAGGEGGVLRCEREEGGERGVVTCV